MCERVIAWSVLLEVVRNASLAIGIGHARFVPKQEQGNARREVIGVRSLCAGHNSMAVWHKECMGLQPSDDDLLTARGAGAGSAAFAVFYKRHERAVLAYFRRRVPSAELAADLASETFAQALVSRRRYRPLREGSAIGWLFGIASHVLSRSLREGVVENRARRHLGIASLPIDDAQLDAIERLGGDATATDALALLPAEQRNAVWARIVEEYDYSEIAAQLQCSEAVVRKRVSRGLAALRRQHQQLQEPT